MAVGGESMLSTSNYLARKFGVRAGMPGFIARKLCPQLVIVPTNFEKYGAISKEIHEVFKRYDPNFSSVSLDEAYLDITDHLENINRLKSDLDMVTAEEVTQEIRDGIFDRVKLTASAGETFVVFTIYVGPPNGLPFASHSIRNCLQQSTGQNMRRFQQTQRTILSSAYNRSDQRIYRQIANSKSEWHR